jgi:hypothetical protein
VVCPHCRTPITGTSVRVHTGTSRTNGVMIDHRPAFHPRCASQHLADTARRFTKQRDPSTGLGVDPATGKPTTTKDTP